MSAMTIHTKPPTITRRLATCKATAIGVSFTLLRNPPVKGMYDGLRLSHSFLHFIASALVSLSQVEAATK
jgi:hypothetical protein